MPEGVTQNSFTDRMQSHGFGSYDFRNTSIDSEDGYFFGKSLADIYDNEGRVVVGNDHRIMSEEVKNGVIAGIRDGGCEPEYVGIVPTDIVSYHTVEADAKGGIAVTASHMPPEYRGIKPLTGQGRIFDENELEEALDRYEFYKENFPAPENVDSWMVLDPESVTVPYIKDIRAGYDELFNQDLSGLEVVLDPGNGTGTVTLEKAFRALGVEEDDIHTVNYDLDPNFPGRGADPSESSLGDLRETVTREKADLGVAVDGDADRVAFVNEKGEKLTGDETLAIISAKYLEESEEENPRVAVSENSSALVEEHILTKGGEPSYQNVGAVFTAKACLKENGAIVGGQPNGHLLDSEFAPYDSGTYFAGVMAGIVNEKGDLSSLQDELPSYRVHRENIYPEDVSGAEDATDIVKMLLDQHKFQNTYQTEEMSQEELESSTFRTRLGESTLMGEDLMEVNVAPLLVFRKSGNEDLVRKMVEVREPEDISELIDTGLNRRH